MFFGCALLLLMVNQGMFHLVSSFFTWLFWFLFYIPMLWGWISSTRKFLLSTSDIQLFSVSPSVLDGISPSVLGLITVAASAAVPSVSLIFLAGLFISILFT